MTPEEWRGRAQFHLEQLEEIWRGEAMNWMRIGPNGDAYYPDELTARIGVKYPWLSAKQAKEMLAQAGRQGQGAGRATLPSNIEDNNKLWQAAYAARILAKLWAELNPEHPQSHPPIAFSNIAAEWFGVDEGQVKDYAGRAASRWPGKHRP